jgi:flagellar protein FlbD
MIALRRLNGDTFILNADYIESVGKTPDTVIALYSGKKIMVKDSVEEVVRKTIRYKQLCHESIRVRHDTGPGTTDG